MEDSRYTDNGFQNSARFEMDTTPRGFGLLMCIDQQIPGIRNYHYKLGLVLENMGIDVTNRMEAEFFPLQALKTVQEFLGKFTINPQTGKCVIGSLILVISSHGDEQGNIYTRDGQISIYDLLEPLKKATHLNDIPKIVILDHRLNADSQPAQINLNLGVCNSIFISGCMKGNLGFVRFSDASKAYARSFFLRNLIEILNKRRGNDFIDIIKELDRKTKENKLIMYLYRESENGPPMPFSLSYSFKHQVEFHSNFLKSLYLNPIMPEPVQESILDMSEPSINHIDDTLTIPDFNVIRANGGRFDAILKINEVKAGGRSQDIGDKLILVRLLYKLEATKLEDYHQFIFGDHNSNLITVLVQGLSGKLALERTMEGNCFVLKNLQIRKSREEYNYPDEFVVFAKNHLDFDEIRELEIPRFPSFEFTSFAFLNQHGQNKNYYDVIGILNTFPQIYPKRPFPGSGNDFKIFYLLDEYATMLAAEVWNNQREHLQSLPPGSIVAIKYGQYKKSENGDVMSIKKGAMIFQITEEIDIEEKHREQFRRLIQFRQWNLQAENSRLNSSGNA